MRILLLSAVLVLTVAGCGDAADPVTGEPVPTPTNVPTQPEPTKQTPPQAPSKTDPDYNRSPRPEPRPAPSPPAYVSMSLSELDGHSFAAIAEADHVEQLPPDIWGVRVETILWGCFGRSYRIDAESFRGLAAYEQMKMLSLAGPVGDAEFAALSDMPALETLELFAFYELNSERFGQIAKITTLKKLILNVSDDKATKAAVAEFRKSRPDVVIEQ